MLLTTTQSDVLTAAERFGEALAEAKTESSGAEYESVLEACNRELERELGIDYGAVCGDDGCC